ncbi:MAG: hypothetical protein Unbinned4409contig1001_22 [Prokaryotic dsDNA virus sp.]|nr:MAG: hypothetical protein Unbinned4409contig1001_22 [Prokaryotic dsDNA virus sp.]|tara:strand:- start:9837 stop:10043 length:207 start_codon:yes stop_codon:yes gene_type:complete
MDTLTQFELLSIVGAIIGMWLKFQNDFTTLKSRVKVLEMDHGELKANIETLLKEIQEVKLLLAKNQVQ